MTPTLDKRFAQKAPFPWFGGKSKAASAIWAALGCPDHLVDPFCGSMAVPLARPEEQVNLPYISETVNDADGLLVNAWRGIQQHPEEVARWASRPVSEIDLTAIHLALVRWKQDKMAHLLAGDITACDPQMAGWWLWGLACWIGGEWCSGTGPWTTDDTGRIYKQLPARGKREPGVTKKLPNIHGNGQGVNHPAMREPGVWDPDWSQYHPVTMPKLVEWMQYLSARLRHVRILWGDWKRALTPSAAETLAVRKPGGVCGVFLDPPYSADAGRDMGLYTHDSGDVAHEVREWCRTHGGNRKYRIVLAGYEGEHTELCELGWREVEWFTQGYLTGGYANQGSDAHQQHRERLWLSPHCLQEEAPRAAVQAAFDWGDEE